MIRGSWKLGDVAGIGVYVHWSFLILPAIIGMSSLAAGGLAAAVQSVAFVLAIFACVALHELGHALAARRYKIDTLDITLLPIGGLARLERLPRDPWQELVIALAGPAVNVVIAVVLFAMLQFTGGIERLLAADVLGGSFLTGLMLANVGLVVFNLLPAFPMDGGRVLRSLLAMKMSYLRATEIASAAGQGMAILFGIAGLMIPQLGLLLVAGFVFIAARGEAAMVRAESSWGDSGRYKVEPPPVRMPPSGIVIIDTTPREGSMPGSYYHVANPRTSRDIPLSSRFRPGRSG